MAKINPQFKIRSYGIYSKWDHDSKELPKIKEFTTEIPAQEDIEFGYILNVKKGKGAKLSYCINHPNITDSNGDVMAPFCDEIHVTNNDWDFFLGDTIWLPIENKTGFWHIVIMFNNKIVADKTFDVSLDHLQAIDDFGLYKRKVTLKR